jgi:ribosomal protein S27AE
MPKLACWSCGREIYTVAPLESLFAEERRCPRCGAFLRADRREVQRRQQNRRVNPANDPGPPNPNPKTTSKAKAKTKANDEPVVEGERRMADRRTGRRRGSGPTVQRGPVSDTQGWQD